jgi:hypothetical protein
MRIREESLMNGSEKGGNNHGGGRPFRRREFENDRGKNYQENSLRGSKRNGDNPPHYDKNRGLIYERPKWTAPKNSMEPLPAPDCPWCGKPIKDISSAISDRESGVPVHFDCAIARIAEGEILEKGDAVAYIGGGRFGIVHFNSPHDIQPFSIKKILEWENKENRAEWRKDISEHFSIT